MWTHPVILSMMALDFSPELLPERSSPTADLCAGHPRRSAPGLGLLYSATSAGALAMGTAMSVRRQVRRAGSVGSCKRECVWGLHDGSLAVSHFFWLSFLMLAAAGAANTVSFVLRNTINQLLTPDEIRGRVTSVNSMFTNTGPQLGQFEAGALASMIGVVGATALGGLLVTSIAAGLAAVASVREIRGARGRVHSNGRSAGSCVSRTLRALLDFEPRARQAFRTSQRMSQRVSEPSASQRLSALLPEPGARYSGVFG